MNDDFDKELQSKDIRPTAMRIWVLKTFMEAKSALSLTDLETLLDTADKSTLFRTLKTFEQRKLIHGIDDGSGSVKYALCHNKCEVDHEDFHVHFLCTQCQHTYCLNDVEIPHLSLPQDFELSNVSLVVKGRCANCR